MAHLQGSISPTDGEPTAEIWYQIHGHPVLCDNPFEKRAANFHGGFGMFMFSVFPSQKSGGDKTIKALKVMFKPPKKKGDMNLANHLSCDKIRGQRSDVMRIEPFWRSMFITTSASPLQGFFSGNSRNIESSNRYSD